MNETDKQFGTRAVHAGQNPDPASGAIMIPIYQTSTYVQEVPGKHKGHEYARVTNPTRSALEANLASLESARHGICFASGVAAIDAILKSLDPGDHIVSTNDLYGGTYRLFREVFEPFGLEFSFVDMTSVQNIRGAIRPETRLLWLETPTNPLLRIIDIEESCRIAADHGIDVAVDNTFASPYLQRPLELGAHLSMHSSTKYLGGHSDLIGGAVCTNSDEWAERLRFQIKCCGAVPGPMDCYLTLRATKTLHIRMQRHCENARRVADFLRAHARTGRVYYPGFEDAPGHEIAARQMSDFGGMVSFELKDDRMEQAVRLMTATEVFTLAESLGGVESLIGHPATMTHASIPRETRIRAGLTDSLIRLSIGIEDVEDLLEDLEHALGQL